ncbi:MAG: hypothetical protein LBQ12_14865 [Deltaproteobacteria bacterium]|nr:hypothetical protein [Deltaproteobacteria bacterium]
MSATDFHHSLPQVLRTLSKEQYNNIFYHCLAPRGKCFSDSPAASCKIFPLRNPENQSGICGRNSYVGSPEADTNCEREKCLK